MSLRSTWLAAAASVWAGAAAAQTPQGTAFTYQGRLADAGSPANGAFDFQFILYDAAVGGSQVGPIVSRDDVVVSGGLFTVPLDFDASFAGSRRWLDVSVRPGASTGTYTPIAPRQELASAPTALFSASTPWTGVAGKPAGFADNVDDDALGGLACGTNEVAKWSGSAWSCANDLVNAGTVTSVATGAGLTGGPITSSGTLGVSFGGGGAATTVARSDHNHLGQLWAGSSGTGLTVESTAAAGNGILGRAGIGSVSGRGVVGEAVGTSGAGVYGHAIASTGSTVGVYGLSASAFGTGVYGEGTEFGIRGQSASTWGTGVFGWQTGTTGNTSGVSGTSQSSAGSGVVGAALAATGATRGVAGESSSSQGIGVYGQVNATSGTTFGVFGRTDSTGGIGVIGSATSTTGLTTGLLGEASSPQGTAVRGHVFATTGPTFGVQGLVQSEAGRGIYGEASSPTGPAVGVHGVSASSQGLGIVGQATALTGLAIGVRGSSSSSSGYGVHGIATATAGTSVGIYGTTNSASGYAGYFSGRVHVAGTLSKAAGSFRIDHPLDPERKYLYHSFVESPDMKNVYDGIVTTDEEGFATVTMPDWFEALNRDFRYQLTVMGDGDWARARVFRGIEGNAFVVQTDRPRVVVSWQVTGIRQDTYAEQHRIPVEEDKPADQREDRADP